MVTQSSVSYLRFLLPSKSYKLCSTSIAVLNLCIYLCQTCQQHCLVLSFLSYFCFLSYYTCFMIRLMPILMFPSLRLRIEPTRRDIFAKRTEIYRRTFRMISTIFSARYEKVFLFSYFIEILSFLLFHSMGS